MSKGAAGRWINWDSGDLHGLYCSKNAIRITKSRGMRWGEACAKRGKRTHVDQGYGGKTWKSARIILKRFFLHLVGAVDSVYLAQCWAN
jgi:hypothetical protein